MLDPDNFESERLDPDNFESDVNAIPSESCLSLLTLNNK